MRTPAQLPSLERLQQVVEISGNSLIWKPRSDVRPEWNSRYAGRAAGCRRADGYVVVSIDKRLYLAHRVIFKLATGHDPVEEVDHKDTLDNSPGNLRAATSAENMWNRRVRRDNEVGLKGVTPIKSTGRFRATIRANGVRHHLGVFATPSEAHTAYCAAAKQLHGPFARTR